MNNSTNTSNSANMTKFLINPSYGGFTFDSKVVKEYENQTGKKIHIYEESYRFDPLIISIIEKSGKYNGLKIVEVLSKYAPYVVISEYDGKEHFIIDENEYKIAEITKIINNENVNSSDNQKLLDIKNILNDNLN